MFRAIGSPDGRAWRMLGRMPFGRPKIGCLAGAVLLGGLAGCGQERAQPWVWSPAPNGTPYSARQPGQTPAVDDHDPSVLVFGTPAFIADERAELTRRDDLMGVRTADALPNRLAWPEPDRPDLDRTRSVRTSTQAERWVYPSGRRDYHYHHYSYRRGW